MSQEQNNQPDEIQPDQQNSSPSESRQTETDPQKDKTRPMAPYDAPETGGPVPEIDDGPSAQPVDDIQEALVDAAQHGTSTEVNFEELPEPIPELDEGPRPGPVDDIQEALFEASQHGASTEVEFERLPEPGSPRSQKVIRFDRGTTPEDAAEKAPETPQPEPKPTPAFQSPPPAPVPAITDFWLLLALFLAFRLLTLFLLKPGGFIRDWSDFDTYHGIAGLSDYGLYPFLDFWLEWPPLVPWLMVGAYRLSLLLPPWPDDPRLWFVLILGVVFVLFEVGNFVLIYRLARRFIQSSDALKRVLWLYAGLFPPVYAMLGFFDGTALFFILLTLNFLLRERRILSAISIGMGFMVKIIPILMLPVALRRLWYQYRHNNREAGIEIGLHCVVVGLTIVLLLSPFLIAGPEWVLASARSMLGRSSWETVWAVADGYYGFGEVAGDRLKTLGEMRQTDGLNFAVHQGSLSAMTWAFITLVFGLIYAFLFTRPADYNQPRNVIAFGGLTVTIFMLWSKGYSPQFLVYLLPFIILLFPDSRGLIYTLVLTGLNILEQPIYFVMLPQATWLLTFIVVVRFIVIAFLAVEFAVDFWGTQKRLVFLLQARPYIPLTLGSLSAVVLLMLTPLMLQTYANDQLDNTPTEAFVGFMQAQAQNVDAANCQTGPDSRRLYLSDQITYRQLYPHLHQDFDIQLVVGAPKDSNFPPVAQLLPDAGLAWILPTGSQAQTLNNQVTQKSRGVDTFDFENLGSASLVSFSRGTNLVCSPLARFSGSIELLTYGIESESGTVNVTLFWRARSPQTRNLKVFTHLLNAEGQQVSGHDSVPRNGIAPTTSWAVDAVQIDPHRIELPSGLPSGNYTVAMGLYTEIGGRLSAFTPSGTGYPNRSVPLQTIQLP